MLIVLTQHMVLDLSAQVFKTLHKLVQYGADLRLNIQPGAVQSSRRLDSNLLLQNFPSYSEKFLWY